MNVKKLNKELISAEINKLLNNNINLENSEVSIDIFSSVNSTNIYLKENLRLSSASNYQLIITEQQTAGIGRNNRSWESPSYKNIYMSLGAIFDSLSPDFSALTIVVAIAVVRSIKRFIISEISMELNNSSFNRSSNIGKDLKDMLLEFLDDLKIKWPNDIYYKGKKLSGILVDSTKKDNSNIQLIMGMGINVNIAPETKDSRDAACLLDIYHDCISKIHSLLNASSKKIILDRNKLIPNIIIELISSLNIFKEQGFLAFRDDWSYLDYLYDKDIELSISKDCLVEGKAMGVDDFGGLLIETKQGIKKVYSAYKCRLIS